MIIKSILSEANIIIDGGAYGGTFANSMLSAFPNCTIHAFEPQEEYCNMIDKRAIVNCKALGDKNETLELNINASRYCSSLLKWSHEADKYVPNIMMQYIETRKISVVTLDSYCEENNILNIDILKLDLQGYEIKALNGAKKMLNNTKVIMTELLYVPLYEGQCNASNVENMLRENDFMWVGYENVAMDSGRIMWQDGIYVKI